MRALTTAASLLALATACPPAPAPPPPAPPTPAPVPPPAPAPERTIASSDPAPASTGVAIVGGGLAGLVTAHELKKAGVPYHLLEATDVVGGRLQTAYYDGGLHAEYGLQEVWGDNPLVQVIKELNVPLDGDVEAPFSSMVLDGKLYAFTQDTNDEYFAAMMKPEEVKQLKDWMAKAKALREKALSAGIKDPEVAKLQKQSFQQWLDGFKMTKRVNDWIRLTIECELAGSASQFSALVGLTEFGVFLGEGEPNYKVSGGNAKLIEALASDAAGHVTTSATVMRVDRRPGGKKVVSYNKAGKQLTLEAEQVVVAVPFWRVHQIAFDPPLAQKKWDAIASLQRGQYTVVHLIVDKKYHELTDKNGGNPFPVLTDGLLGVIYGAQSEAPPESPNEVFAFLVHGGEAYGPWHMQRREARLKEMLGAMDKLWPGFSKLVRNSYVYTYHPGSIALWPVTRSPLDDLNEALRTPEDGLYLAGDYLFSGHSDGAAKSALAASAAIVKARASTKK